MSVEVRAVMLLKFAVFYDMTLCFVSSSLDSWSLKTNTVQYFKMVGITHLVTQQ